MNNITFINDFLKYLKENLPDRIEKLNLKQVVEYLNYQPYYLEEFPESTPLISLYHVRDIPSDVEWEHHYELDLYYYFEKPILNKVSGIMEQYANTLKELISDSCWHPDISEIAYNTFYAETSYYLISVSTKFRIYG